MIDMNAESDVDKLLTAAGHLAIRPRKMMAEMGKQLEVDMREHFDARERVGNQNGWPRRHFWADVEASTALTDVEDDSATVTVSDPRFPQKVFGGTIKPKRGRALAIPLTPEAYEQGSPKEWDDQDELFVYTADSGRGFLAVQEGHSLRIHYLLTSQVVQAKDPKALPDPAALRASILQRGRKVLARELQNREGAASA